MDPGQHSMRLNGRREGARVGYKSSTMIRLVSSECELTLETFPSNSFFSGPGESVIYTFLSIVEFSLTIVYF